MTTITTAAELDALPVRSVVAYDTSSGVPAVKRHDGRWAVAGYHDSFSSHQMVHTTFGSSKGPLTLLTPDEPVATGADVPPAPAAVDREAVRVALGYAIARHRVGPVGANVRSAEDDALARDLVDAVLALLPATVKPDRGDLMRLVQNEVGGFLAHDPERPEAFYGYIADAILAAWPGRTEAEVLREFFAASRTSDVPPAYAHDDELVTLVHARMKEHEAEVRADERERIAREIEETAPAWSLTTNQAALVRQFARIAREGGQR